MLGLPMRLVIADRVRERLVREEAPDAHVVTQQRVWYMLGALELALGDFVAHERPVGFGAPRTHPVLLSLEIDPRDRGG
jgi:hypothetical protein